MNRKITLQSVKSLLIACAACLLPLGMSAATFTYDGINYKTGSGTKATQLTIQKYTITKASGDTPADTAFYSGDIVIPETITYEGTEYTVVATAANAFLDCKDLTSLSLPSTCVTIARNSFKGCSSLKVSPIPATATSVGTGVFNGCTSLEEVTIVPGWSKPVSEEMANCPSLKRLIIADGSTAVTMKLAAFGTTEDAQSAIKSIEYIYIGRNVDASAYTNAEQPFHNMTALKEVVIGGSTTELQSTVFQGATALQTVTFEDGNAVAAIGSSAFSGCTSLPTIAIPTAVTAIEQSTFYNCKNLTSITMGDNVTSIGITAFYNTGLTSFTFPSALTSIGTSAFQKSKLAGEITLPSALTSIGGSAFAETALTGVSIPASVTYIGEAAFAPITTLAAITLDSGNTSFQMNEGVLLSADGTRLLVSAHEGDLATSYSSSTVTTIDKWGLGYAPFTTVNFPALQSIGDYGFAYSDIQSFTLEKDVTVGINIFDNSGLQEITISEGRNEIPQGLCANCANLTTVSLPSTTTNMMRNCFGNCTSLKEMEIPANVNYMEPGSVPETIQTLRVLNVNTPALAAGVFNSGQDTVLCKVAVNSVDLYKAAAQWQYLNIVGDATITGTGASLGCPTGLYFATSDGKLLYKNEDGEIIDTEFNAGEHAFTLQSYKNRIYVAVAGNRFTYQDPSQPLGDGELFYVNNTNGIFYRVTVLNNVGYAPSEDPFTMFIDSISNMIYISDRNVGIHELDADTTGLYGSQPFLLQNQWLPFYNDEISWGAITGGFALDSHGIFWMSKKFNGLCLLRFNRGDIYPDGGSGKTKTYAALFKDVIIKTFYLDEENGYLYMHVQKDSYGAKPGIYRVALSKIEDVETGADAAGASSLQIADCELLDSSPIYCEGTENSGEITCVAQITGDGDNIYWGYIAPAAQENAISGSDELDTSNPLHHSGIKTIGAKPDADGNMPTEITFAVEGVEAYGICGATYVAPTEPDDPTIATGDVNADGEVNIADVNALISIILGNSTEEDYAGVSDVNADAEINIADVNAVIAIILGN